VFDEWKDHDHQEKLKAMIPTSPGDEVVEVVREQLQRLPLEVGAVLVGVGVLSMTLPGLAEPPIFLTGALVLIPGTFNNCDRWAQKRFPKSHRIGMKQVERFIDDLEKRYPGTADPQESQ
jgi:hypothetical protein